MEVTKLFNICRKLKITLLVLSVSDNEIWRKLNRSY